MNGLKATAFKVLAFLFKNTVGRGLGKIPFTIKIYDYLYRKLVVTELILNVHGSKMITRVSNDDPISYQLLFNRNGMEMYETKLFKNLVTKGMTVVDVGANIGYYTLLAAKLVGDKGRVIAFEPEPQNYALLVRNIKLNSYRNVVPVKKAVSRKTGTADLFINKQAGAHGFFPDRDDNIGVTRVETVSLDQYFKGRENPIDIIKIDVEGAELAVLQGMPNIIRNNDNLKVFTEFFWPSGLQKSGFSPRQYWDKLSESGFKFIYLINDYEQKLELTDLASVVRYGEDMSVAKLPSPNLLCTKIPLGVSSH
jgi:FkbM family methyltransferase